MLQQKGENLMTRGRIGFGGFHGSGKNSPSRFSGLEIAFDQENGNNIIDRAGGRSQAFGNQTGKPSRGIHLPIAIAGFQGTVALVYHDDGGGLRQGVFELFSPRFCRGLVAHHQYRNLVLLI